MFARLKPLQCVICLLCLWSGMPLASAATWQEQRDAGFLAFSNADYIESVEHLEQALAGAREDQASPEELGVILERLTTSYFAVRRFRSARESIAQWDDVLGASAGEPWANRQQTDRDIMAVLVSEVLGEAEPEVSTSDAPPEQPATAAETPTGSADEGAAYDIEVDLPFEPDEPIDPPADETSGATEETAAVSPAAVSPASSGVYGVHLLSLKELEAVEASWDELQESYPDLLADKELEVRQIELDDQGLFYRLYATPFADAAAAGAACEAFEQLQQYCAVATLD